MPRSGVVRAAAVASALLIAVIAWYLGSPLFIRTTANEAIPSPAAIASATSSASTPPLGATPATQTDPSPTVLARGELQFVDSLHNGKGPVMLLRIGDQRLLRFENVAITNAPDVHVYLSRETGGKWTESTSLYLGALKATNGSFNYDIPANADLTPYKSVVVWCRAFAVLVTWADLKAA
jgi:hypothetical protein